MTDEQQERELRFLRWWWSQTQHSYGQKHERKYETLGEPVPGKYSMRPGVDYSYGGCRTTSNGRYTPVDTKKNSNKK